jgi:hypothetical protein
MACSGDVNCRRSTLIISGARSAATAPVFSLHPLTSVAMLYHMTDGAYEAKRVPPNDAPAAHNDGGSEGKNWLSQHKKFLGGLSAAIGAIGAITGILAWAGLSLGTIEHDVRLGHNSGISASSPNCLPQVRPPRGDKNVIFVALSEEHLNTRNCWSPLLAPVRPGTILKYLLTYRNTSSNEQENVVARISLAPGLLAVPNSTRLANGNHPNGERNEPNSLTDGGIIIGNYYPGGIAYITLEVAVSDSIYLSCGTNTFRSVGSIGARNIDVFYNVAEFQMLRSC